MVRYRVCNAEVKEEEMPMIRLTGVPREFRDTAELDDLMLDIQNAVASVSVLGIDAGEVMVFTQDDQVKKGLGEEIIAEICGLFRRPERTPEVIEELRQAICAELRKFAEAHVSQCMSYEAMVAYWLEPNELTLYVKGEHGFEQLKFI